MFTRRSNDLRVVTQENRKEKNEREHPLRVLLYGIEYTTETLRRNKDDSGVRERRIAAAWKRD